MKHKSILLGAVLATVMLLSISGLAFAANAADTLPNSINGDVGEQTCLAPGGKTDSQLEFWKVDEFESWMEQQHKENQRLADSHDKSFYGKGANGDYYCREWTQADVDALYNQWQEQLSLMIIFCACAMIRMCATPSSSCVNGRLSIISALPMLCASRRRGLTDVISTPATLPTIRAVPCSHPAGRVAVAADVPADKPRPERYRRVRAIFTRLFVPLSGRKGGFRRAGEGKGTSAGKPL